MCDQPAMVSLAEHLTAGPGPTPEEAAAATELRVILCDLIGQLPPRAAYIITRRFGFGAPFANTLDEVGDGLGITRGTVRQLEAKALRWLRLAPQADRLAAFAPDAASDARWRGAAPVRWGSERGEKA